MITPTNHPTTSQFEGQFFKNHYDFINVLSHPSSKIVEARLKELAPVGEEDVEIDGQPVFLPFPDFNSLFLIRHTAAYFAASKMGLRQILDWATFVQKYHSSVDWRGLEAFVESVGMMPFYQILNGICVDYWGFSAAAFPAGRHELDERVMDDVLCPEFSDPCPQTFLSQWLWRYRRWRRGAWRQKLVYPESILRTFFVQLKSHLMKPAELGKI